MANMILCSRCRTNTEKGKSHKCISNSSKPVFDREKEHRHIYNTKRWQVLRDYVKGVCPMCARCGSIDNIEVHHIYKLEKNIERAYDISNVVPLCRSCHRYTDKNIKDGELDFKWKELEYEYNLGI